MDAKRQSRVMPATAFTRRLESDVSASLSSFCNITDAFEMLLSNQRFVAGGFGLIRSWRRPRRAAQDVDWPAVDKPAFAHGTARPHDVPVSSSIRNVVVDNFHESCAIAESRSDQPPASVPTKSNYLVIIPGTNTHTRAAPVRCAINLSPECRSRHQVASRRRSQQGYRLIPRMPLPIRVYPFPAFWVTPVFAETTAGGCLLYATS